MAAHQKTIFPDGTLICCRCKERKPFKEFGKRAGRALGYLSKCRKCHSLSVMENRDKDRHSSYMKQWKQQNADLINAYRRSRLRKDPEKMARNLLRIAKWQKENPDRARLARKNYMKNNPEKARVYAQNRRAKTRGSGGRLSRNLSALLFLEQGGKCPYCLRSLKETGYELDHYVPVSCGGMHDDTNIQLLCPPCNKQKSNRDPAAMLRLAVLKCEPMAKYLSNQVVMNGSK